MVPRSISARISQSLNLCSGIQQIQILECNSWGPRAPGEATTIQQEQPRRGLQAETSLLIATKTDMRKAEIQWDCRWCVSLQWQESPLVSLKEGVPGDQLQLLKLVPLQLQKNYKDTGEKPFEQMYLLSSWNALICQHRETKMSAHSNQNPAQPQIHYI